LRPVNVCCAIVASHFVAPEGRTFPKPRLSKPLFGVEFRFALWTVRLSPGRQNPESKYPVLKNAKRRTGRSNAPARQKPLRHGLQSPKLPISQRLAAKPCGSSCRPCFRAAAPIWDGNRGKSRGIPINPHTFSCWPPAGWNPAGAGHNANYLSSTLAPAFSS
jgi:hypothetical protein